MKKKLIEKNIIFDFLYDFIVKNIIDNSTNKESRNTGLNIDATEV